MRELKFRAWSKERKKMYWLNMSPFFESLRDDEDDNLSLQFGHSGHCDFTESESVEKFVLMQFVGLKDGVGKGIYEGDIYVFKWEGERRTAPIKWNIEDACFDMDCGKFSISFDEMWARGGRVIGNIHENPELI